MNAGVNDDGQTPTFAVALTSQDGQWMSRILPDRAMWDLDVATRAVRDLRSEGPNFGMVCVDDDWFVLIRPTPRGTQLLLSDATAAVVDDYAAEVLDELDVDVPDMDPDERADAEPWPEGDLEILEDLGVPSDVLAVICDDDELWASEQLLRIAEEINADEELADVAQLDY